MGGRSGQSVKGKSGGGGGGGYSENAEGVLISKDVNEVEMRHYTSSEAAESIKKSGFNQGSNNMFGEGIYFTNQKIDGKGFESNLKVELKDHKQIFIKNDFDTYKEVSKATGGNINNGFQIKQALLSKGFKSMRIKQEDGSTWTVILDKSVIKSIK